MSEHMKNELKWVSGTSLGIELFIVCEKKSTSIKERMHLLLTGVQREMNAEE